MYQFFYTIKEAKLLMSGKLWLIIFFKSSFIINTCLIFYFDQKLMQKYFSNQQNCTCREEIWYSKYHKTLNEAALNNL